MRLSKAQIREMVSGVHGRICDLFPLFVVSGWCYRGFQPDEVGGVGVVVLLRFEKIIRGRTAYVEIQIGEMSFNNPLFDLRAFIIEQLHTEEAGLIRQREQQLDCVA